MSDEKNHEIVVNKFTEQSAREFRNQVIKRAMQDPSAPIIVYIDSYGGFVDSLNMMLETIFQVPNKIITVCIGKAMSCGAVLLAAGDYRFCGKFSRIMIHQSTSGAYGPTEELQKNVDENKRLNEQFIDFLAERCGVTVDYLKDLWKEHEARDLYLTAEDGVNLGIVDFVGTPHVKPVVNYEIEVAPEKEYEKVGIEIYGKIEDVQKALKNKKKKTTKKKAKKKTKKKRGK
jgi:ATP-dependent Clp protease protease subunit